MISGELQDFHSQNKSDSFRVSWLRRAPDLYSGGLPFELWPETDSPKLYATCFFCQVLQRLKTPEDAMASFHIFFSNALFTVVPVVSDNYS
jgi:hypothetical protein